MSLSSVVPERPAPTMKGAEVKVSWERPLVPGVIRLPKLNLNLDVDVTS